MPRLAKNIFLETMRNCCMAISHRLMTTRWAHPQTEKYFLLQSKNASETEAAEGTSKVARSFFTEDEENLDNEDEEEEDEQVFKGFQRISRRF